MKKFIPFVVAATLALGACASSGGAGDASKTAQDAQAAIMAAEDETKLAKAIGFEWRDTGKLIKKAKEAEKEGKFDEAVKLANKAKNQSTSALAQAEAQKNAAPRY